MSETKSCESAQPRLIAAKPKDADAKSHRVDIARASLPNIAIAITSVMRYAVCTQLNSSSGVCNDCAMRGNAVATI